jgi:hypothetical protein
MVLGANTFREFLQMLSPGAEESAANDPLAIRMRNMPTTVVSTTLEEPLDWPDATVVRGEPVDVVARLKRGVRGAVALARQRVVEPGADGRRPGRSPAGDALPCHHRSNRI